MRCMVAANSRFIQKVCEVYSDVCGIMSTSHTGNNTLNISRVGVPWCCDNGFYTKPDIAKFRTLCCNVAHLPRLQWVAVPDVVGDARATLKSWQKWEGWMRGLGLPLAFVLQDGIMLKDCPPAECYFIGGSTEFKLSSEVALLARHLKERGSLIHMGRVNTLRRIVYANSIGCDSFDGSSIARWTKTYLVWACKWCRYLAWLDSKTAGVTDDGKQA